MQHYAHLQRWAGSSPTYALKSSPVSDALCLSAGELSDLDKPASVRALLPLGAPSELTSGSFQDTNSQVNKRIGAE
jgi:hypothetical protein